MQLQDYGPTPAPEPPVQQHDDRRGESDPGDLLDVVDVVEAFDTPCHLDLGCFDVSDCAGGIDCVPCDLSF